MIVRAQTTLKAWGNSIGVIIPREALRSANLSVDDAVEVQVKKATNPLREAFGKLKGNTRGKRSTHAILREVDKAFQKGLP